MLKKVFTQLTKVFSPAVLAQAEVYQKEQYVLYARFSEGLIKARVKGQEGQLYDIYLDLHAWPAKPAQCSCPVRVNCKHVAATLLELKIREEQGQGLSFSNTSSNWLKNVFIEEKKKEAALPAKTLLYLLNFQEVDNQFVLTVTIALAKRLKSGNLGAREIIHTFHKAHKFFNLEDKAIAGSLIFTENYYDWFNNFTINQSEVLENILRTKRAYWHDDPAIPLIQGDAQPAELEWKLDVLGKQYLHLYLAPGLYSFFLDKAWYFSAESHTFGYLDTPYDMEQLQLFLNAPPLESQEVGQVAESLEKMYPGLAPPKKFKQIIRHADKPVPILTIDAILVEEGLDYKEFHFDYDVFFQYDQVRLPASLQSDIGVFADDDVLIEMVRNEKLEKKALNLIQRMHFPLFGGEEEALFVMEENFPVLEKAGWKIECEHPLFAKVLDAETVEWFSQTEEKEGFFDYQLGIIIDGQEVNIVSLVAEVLTSYKANTLNNMSDEEEISLLLPNKQRLKIKFERLRPLIQFLLQYESKWEDKENLRLNRYQFLLMQETEQALKASASRWQGGEQLRHQLKQFITGENIPTAPIPAGLKTTLRDYQQQGLNWLQLLRQTQFGGILADDMGLGKTIQTLAHLQLEKEEGRLTAPSLIVAPTSLMGNWLEEAKRFTPELKVLIFHGNTRHQDPFESYDVIISTYGLIQRDKTIFLEHTFYYLILDEAQTIKNARAKTTLIIQQLKATHRLCLSGTPLENHLGELWSLFNFIMPGLLGDTRQFKQFFKIPIEKEHNIVCQKRLAQRIKPFMLRRTKNQVATELPGKTEIMHSIILSGTQRDLYEAIRLSMEKKVREAISRLGLNKSQIILLDALLKLRQICCDPRLLSIPEAAIAHGNSAKLEACMELLQNLIQENRRILVFSQFTSMLDLLEKELQAHHYSYLKLTGQTLNRQQLVNQFQEGNTSVFLISLKAGGTGLNLTRADTVIHYDPWWNPAVEDQATGRSYRIGQENPVFVYKLITSGTVEEAILALQEKKRALFDGILTDNLSQVQGITENDITQFFLPLNGELL